MQNEAVEKLLEAADNWLRDRQAKPGAVTLIDCRKSEEALVAAVETWRIAR